MVQRRSIPKPTPAKVTVPRARDAAVVDLSHLPVILRLSEMAAVYRVSAHTIRRGLQDNTFRPLPFEKYPYRWLRDDVIRDLQTRHLKLKTRRHGFAATKAKRQLEAKTVAK